jgi:alkylation response protein AidB-like acyl-CoA dehydrogenase
MRMATHTEAEPVWPAAVRGINFYATDKMVHDFMKRKSPDLLTSRQKDLESFGAFCGGVLDEQAEYSDRIYPPVWKNMPADPARPGERRGKLFFNPRYEACHQDVYRRGFIASAFDAENGAPHLYTFIAQYLMAQADISIGCPFAMTHPVALIVDRYAPDSVKERFLHELTRTDGHTKTGGTWATEKHSGSDVAQTQTKAVYQEDGTVRLHGRKWFASNADSGLVLATARPEDAPEGGKGLGLYLVPSHCDEAWHSPNHYEVTYLKEKIGTRALATGEINLDGALAWEIAPPPDGLRVMMEALGCSRVHNAMASAGIMRRALLEALCWASHRSTFGKKLIDHPLARKRILEIAVQWMAGSILAFEAAYCFDAAPRDEHTRSWSRLVTALAKYKTAEQAVWCVQKSLSLIGGNGYTEDYPVARLYRDVMVLPVWEGPEQIQALELMRQITGKAAGAKIFIEKLEEIVAALPAPVMQPEKDRLRSLHTGMHDALAGLHGITLPSAAEAKMDDFLHRMADILAYALLCEDAAADLKQNKDSYKLLVSNSFYRDSFERPPVPVLEDHLLLENFDAIIGECL